LLKRILSPERINALFAALIIIGLALIIVSAWRYLDAAQRLASSEAPPIPEDNTAAPEQAQGFVAAGVQRRRLERQQNESLMLGGIGLASLALGWLAHDMVQARRRARQRVPSSPAEEGT
jgi:hypothetical protein